MFAALVSLETATSVKPDVAVTGEITLRGLVLPIGGVKEKVLAAKRSGIHHIVLPERNKKDMVDLPAEARKGLRFDFVENVDQALRLMLTKAIAPKTPARKPKTRS
jgi:ATP-dependent Lon protease